MLTLGESELGDGTENRLGQSRKAAQMAAAATRDGHSYAQASAKLEKTARMKDGEEFHQAKRGRQKGAQQAQVEQMEAKHQKACRNRPTQRL